MEKQREGLGVVLAFFHEFVDFHGANCSEPREASCSLSISISWHLILVLLWISVRFAPEGATTAAGWSSMRLYCSLCIPVSVEIQMESLHGFATLEMLVTVHPAVTRLHSRTACPYTHGKRGHPRICQTQEGNPRNMLWPVPGPWQAFFQRMSCRVAKQMT